MPPNGTEPPWKKPAKFIAALAILGGAGWGTYALMHNLPSGPSGEKLAAEAPPVVTVTTALAKTSRVEEKMAVTGTIRSWDELKVGSEVGGLHVKSIYVEEGQHVKKGQLLAELNANLFLAQLSQAEAKLKSARANLVKSTQPNRPEEIAGLQASYEQAKNKLQQEQLQLGKAKVNLEGAELLVPRYEFLATRGAVSQVEAESKRMDRDKAKIELQTEVEKVEAAENDVEIARQKLLQAKNGGRREDVLVTEASCDEIKGEIKRLEEQINQTKIKAPDDGKILQRNVHIGDTSDFSKPFFILSRLNKLELVAQVNNQDLSRLHEGQKVLITGSEVKNARVEGTVRIVGPQINETSRLAPVKIELPYSPKLLPGMFVRGEILLSAHDGLTVPLSCLETRGDKTYVFRLENKRAVFTPVQAGAHHNGNVEILSGLTEGQAVIEKGAQFLSDRDPVAVAD